MSAEIINLRQFRKQRARAEREKQAEENRARSGQTKADRRHETAKKELDRSRLDGLQRKTDKDDHGINNDKPEDIA